MLEHYAPKRPKWLRWVGATIDWVRLTIEVEVRPFDWGGAIAILRKTRPSDWGEVRDIIAILRKTRPFDWGELFPVLFVVLFFLPWFFPWFFPSEFLLSESFLRNINTSTLFWGACLESLLGAFALLFGLVGEFSYDKGGLDAMKVRGVVYVSVATLYSLPFLYFHLCIYGDSLLPAFSAFSLVLLLPFFLELVVSGFTKRLQAAALIHFFCALLFCVLLFYFLDFNLDRALATGEKPAESQASVSLHDRAPVTGKKPPSETSPPRRSSPSLSPAGVEARLHLRSAERKLVQWGLAALGHAPGQIDGRFGPKTRAALKSWQASKGYQATGYLNRDQANDLIATGAAPGATLRGTSVRPPATGSLLALDPAVADFVLPGRSFRSWVFTS